jgi:hypothetical protein
LVERKPEELRAGGSIPSLSTIGVNVRYILGLILIALALSASASHASTSRYFDTDGLTEVEAAEIQKQIALRRESAKKKDQLIDVSNPPSSEKLNVWVDAGVQLGKGLAAVAKELGVAANDFVKTPVGKLTAAVILYKFMGKDLIKLIVGLLFMAVSGSVWIYMVRRIAVIEKIVVTEDIKDNKKISKKEVIYGQKWYATGDGTKFIIFITGIFIPATGLLVILI